MNDPCGVPGPPRCPECGTALSVSRLEGLCPVCLLEEPAPSDSAAGEEPRFSGPGLMFLPGYRLTREIARGGMGIIYEAVQQNPSRTVAIKMLLPHLMEDPAMRERFRREAQSMAGLDHPGILPIYEVGDHGGLPFFSMKLAPGGTLSSQAWRYRKNWRQIAGLMAHLADAIQTAHHHGVLHRDLKPANILFDEQNRAYLSDFGIAKQLDADPADLNLTKSSTLMGTPNYLPPEWAGGTARSATTAGDLYGLGAILYQLLTGDPPHRAAQLTTLLRQIADDPVMPPRQIDRAIPRDLEVICLKATAKDPAHRYSTAADLAADLRLWLDGRPIKARPASLTEKLWRWGRRNPLPASLAGGLAAALILGGSALWLSWQDSRTNLHDSLVAQASALRETGRLGNRAKAIAALEQAIQLRPSAAVRTELASALAMADLRSVGAFPFGSGERVHADAAFSRYTHLDTLGHITVRDLRNHAVISQVPGDILDPEGYGPFSPDGRFMALRQTRGGPYSIWDSRHQAFLRRDVAGTFLLFGPDSRTLAVGNENGTLTLMDLSSGTVLSRFETGLKPVRPYSFSPDGTRLVAGQFKASRFAVFDTTTGRALMREEHPPAARVRCAVWRPDGRGFFIGTESFKIYEWSMTANSLPRQYTGHQGNIFALAMHPGGEWLLSQSDDGTTRLWNTANAGTVAELPFYGSEVRFSRDGHRMLCEDREARLLRILELIPSSVCRQFPVPHPDPDHVGTRGCWFVTFSPDGGLLSVGDTHGILHFDGTSGAYLGAATSGYCWSLAWAPNGSRLFGVSKDGLQSWSTLATGLPVKRQERPPIFFPSTRLDPASAGDALPAPGPWGGHAAPERLSQAIAPAGGQTLLPPDTLVRDVPVAPRLAPGLNHVAVSADCRTLAMAFDAAVGLFDTVNNQWTRTLPRVPALLDDVAINGDGSLAAASQQKSAGVPVWETASGRRVALLPTQFAEATLCFSPDRRHLFTGDLEHLTCWDARTAAVVWQVPCPARSSTAVQVALTPDGRLLASNLTPEVVTIFDATTGKEITQLRHPTPYPIGGLAFSPDHGRLAVLCLGHLVQLWDLRALRQELTRRSLDWPAPNLPAPRPPLSWSLLQERLP